jgi:hypothetical protein
MQGALCQTHAALSSAPCMQKQQSMCQTVTNVWTLCQTSSSYARSLL